MKSLETKHLKSKCEKENGNLTGPAYRKRDREKEGNAIVILYLIVLVELVVHKARDDARLANTLIAKKD